MIKNPPQNDGRIGGFDFTGGHEEEVVFHQKDLRQLFPFGLTVPSDQSRPFLILKDDKGHVLPVAVSAIEAGVTLSQSNPAAIPLTPHRFTSLLLQSLNMRAVQCVFVQIQGPHQYVRIYLSGHAGTNSIRLRAEEAMSLCLHLNIPIYATEDYMNRSKVLAAQIEGMNVDLKKFSMLHHGRKPTYMM